MHQKQIEPTRSDAAARSAFWASAAFYSLIAFEFFYMFSPFAAYIYGIYGPGLSVLNMTESTSWLISFFMPHIARETQSLFISWHEAIGMVIFLSGLTGFIVGAAQIYWSKLTHKGAVSGGIYRQIRHPQYLALMISSFGMVLVWPRYLVLLGFVTVCFAYFFLARMEERNCSRKFPGYDAYRSTTGMFLPRSIERLAQHMPWPQKRPARIICSFGLYIAAVLVFFSVARGVKDYAVNNLYTHSTENEIYLSLGQLNPGVIAELSDAAKSDTAVSSRLTPYLHGNHRLVNYVMPADLFVSEVPMFIPEGSVPSHEMPGSKDQNRFKIIFTTAHFGPASPAAGLDILRNAINKSPILEVWIHRESQRVEKILDPSADEFYDGMPVPVF